MSRVTTTAILPLLLLQFPLPYYSLLRMLLLIKQLHLPPLSCQGPCNGIPCAAVLWAVGVPRTSNCCAIAPRAALSRHTFFCFSRC